MNRLFIALKLPLEIVEEINSLRQSVYDDGIKRKWESSEKLHLTIKFLGDVEDSRTDLIIKKIDKVLSGEKKINCSYEKFGFFLPRILWLSLKCDKVIYDIAGKIEDEMAELGFQKEKRGFKPHITLLRIKEIPDNKFISGFNNYKLPERNFICDKISLMKSRLLPGGSVYSDIKVFNLI
jgi:RNA 2',3'-cyclic 3'-phosphodiesterase